MANKTPLETELRIKNTLGIQQLEAIPALAVRAFQIASNPKSTISDFVKIVESDEAISSRVIKIANSVYFRRGEEAKDIDKAVATIGINELRCLLSATLLKGLLKGKNSAREQLWANAVATAIMCRRLSSYTLISEGEAFLCGLLHDVGKLIMSRRDAVGYTRVINTVAQEAHDFNEVEEKIFNLTHTEIGLWIGERWSFPEAALNAIANHHNAWPNKDNLCGKGTSASMLIKAADTIAHASGIGHPFSYRQFQKYHESQMPYACRQLGLDQNQGSSLIEQCKRYFNDEYSLYQLD